MLIVAGSGVHKRARIHSMDDWHISIALALNDLYEVTDWCIVISYIS